MSDELTKLVLVAAYSIEDENGSTDDTEEQLCEIEELCNIKIDRNKSVKQQLFFLVEQLCSLYNEQETEEITQMIPWLSEGIYKFPKSYFQGTVLLPFENTKIPVPIAYDAVLRKKYGDYMKPVHKGGSHEYPFYKKQEAVLQERLGAESLRYDVKKFFSKK